MNPFDSTIESIPEISKIFDEDCNCTAIDKTIGEFCGETETLKIINEFQKLYETRIENVDREFENEFDQVCVSSFIIYKVNLIYLHKCKCKTLKIFIPFCKKIDNNKLRKQWK